MVAGTFLAPNSSILAPELMSQTNLFSEAFQIDNNT
jgi:hypothetical protein